jgi:cytochrome c-type biogenesis protein CcmF
MGIGPLARWRSARLPELARQLRWAFAVSAASALLAPLLLGHWTPMIGFGVLLGVWVASSTVANLVLRLRAHPAPRWQARLAAQPGSYYGMLLAHLGIAVFVLGVTGVNGFQVERDLRMAPGDVTTIGGLTARFDGVAEQPGPNYTAARGTLVLSRDGDMLATLHPERRVYTVSRSPMTETAIQRTLLRDVYISLGEPLADGAWSVRVYYKPLVAWIWLGCVLMALGGVLAVVDRRYRARRTATAPAGAALAR